MDYPTSLTREQSKQLIECANLDQLYLDRLDDGMLAYVDMRDASVIYTSPTTTADHATVESLAEQMGERHRTRS